jgi:hypothetical protein
MWVFSLNQPNNLFNTFIRLVNLNIKVINNNTILLKEGSQVE